MNLAQRILVLLIRLYRATLSPVLGLLCGPTAGCRFHPTCSAYALVAVEKHGAWRGTWLAVCRLCRCHPWSSGGEDPVPEVGGSPGSPGSPLAAPVSGSTASRSAR